MFTTIAIKMIESFIILLREGLECFLILGIILGYLKKTNRTEFNKSIYIGSVIAILASILCAVLFQVVLGGYTGMLHYMIEGFSKLFAVAILTFMLFWMRNASKNLEGDLERTLDKAQSETSITKHLSLGLFAFVTIFKEGIEVTLFLGAISSQITVSGEIIGSILGLIAALVIVFIIFKTSINFKLKTFFNIMGTVIIIIAAGLASGIVEEFQTAGLIPIFVEHLYNLNNFFSPVIQSVLSFLHGIIGYQPSPSLLQVIVYVAYLAIILKIYFIKDKKIVSRNNESTIYKSLN